MQRSQAEDSLTIREIQLKYWQSVERMSQFDLAFNLCKHYADVITAEEFVRMFLHLKHNHPIDMLRADMFAIYMERYHNEGGI